MLISSRPINDERERRRRRVGDSAKKIGPKTGKERRRLKSDHEENGNDYLFSKSAVEEIFRDRPDALSYAKGILEERSGDVEKFDSAYGHSALSSSLNMSSSLLDPSFPELQQSGTWRELLYGRSYSSMAAFRPEREQVRDDNAQSIGEPTKEASSNAFARTEGLSSLPTSLSTATGYLPSLSTAVKRGGAVTVNSAAAATSSFGDISFLEGRMEALRRNLASEELRKDGEKEAVPFEQQKYFLGDERERGKERCVEDPTAEIEEGRNRGREAVVSSASTTFATSRLEQSLLNSIDHLRRVAARVDSTKHSAKVFAGLAPSLMEAEMSLKLCLMTIRTENEIIRRRYQELESAEKKIFDRFDSAVETMRERALREARIEKEAVIAENNELRSELQSLREGKALLTQELHDTRVALAESRADEQQLRNKVDKLSEALQELKTEAQRSSASAALADVVREQSQELRLRIRQLEAKLDAEALKMKKLNAQLKTTEKALDIATKARDDARKWAEEETTRLKTILDSQKGDRDALKKVIEDTISKYERKLVQNRALTLAVEAQLTLTTRAKNRLLEELTELKVSFDDQKNDAEAEYNALASAMAALKQEHTELESAFRKEKKEKDTAEYMANLNKRKADEMARNETKLVTAFQEAERAKKAAMEARFKLSVSFAVARRQEAALTEENKSLRKQLHSLTDQLQLLKSGEAAIQEQAMTAAATAARDAAEKEALLAREAEQKMRDELKELTECFYDTLMAHSSLETREKVEIMSVMKAKNHVSANAEGIEDMKASLNEGQLRRLNNRSTAQQEIGASVKGAVYEGLPVSSNFVDLFRGTTTAADVASARRVERMWRKKIMRRLETIQEKVLNFNSNRGYEQDAMVEEEGKSNYKGGHGTPTVPITPSTMATRTPGVLTTASMTNEWESAVGTAASLASKKEKEGDTDDDDPISRFRKAREQKQQGARSNVDILRLGTAASRVQTGGSVFERDEKVVEDTMGAYGGENISSFVSFTNGTDLKWEELVADEAVRACRSSEGAYLSFISRLTAAKEKAMSLRETVQKSALILQRAYRGYAGRKLANAAKLLWRRQRNATEREKAATKLQRHYRLHRRRKDWIRQEKQKRENELYETERAAVNIQRIYRGHLSRLHVISERGRLGYI